MKKSKVLSVVLSGLIALSAIPFMGTGMKAFADGCSVSGDGSIQPGGGGGGWAIGDNTWCLIPSIDGKEECLYIFTYTTYNGGGSYTSQKGPKYLNYQDYYWAVTDNIDTLDAGSQQMSVNFNETNGKGRDRVFSNTVSLCSYTDPWGTSSKTNNSDFDSWNEIAERLNSKNGTSLNGTKVKFKVKNFLETQCFRINAYESDSGKKFWEHEYGPGVIVYDSNGNGKCESSDELLTRIELDSDTFGDDHNHHKKNKIVSTPESQSTVENKWYLKSLVGRLTAESYSPSSGVAGYNTSHNVTNTVTKTNNGGSKYLWDNASDLSYTQKDNYCWTSTDKLTGTYQLLKRSKGKKRTKVETYYDIHKCTDSCEKECYIHEYKSTPDKTTYTAWKEDPNWTYSFTSTTKKVNLSDGKEYTVYNPKYNQYNWLDLTTEEFTSDSSAFSNKYSKAVNFKSNSGTSGKNLSASLTTGKDKGKMFQILSDNNAKAFSLNFDANSVFGIPFEGFSKNRNGTKGTSYLLNAKLYGGPCDKAQNLPPLISIQKTSPTSSSESTGKVTWDYTGQTKLTNKFRSIKFGTYTIGDANGTNYWYEMLEMATVNKFGTKYTGKGKGLLTSTPTTSAVSLSKTDLNKSVDLSATFVQPILVGKIDVKDAAGYED